MTATTMTPRERWLAVLRHEQSDRLPIDYRATPEATAKVMAYLGCSESGEMLEQLHIDPVVHVHPRYIGPPLEPNHDMYGSRFVEIDYGGGTYSECFSHPLAQYTTIEEIEANYMWPSPDWFDYSDLPAQVQGREHLPIQGGGSEPFLVYKQLRGMEQAYVDLVLYPELVHYCLDQLFDFCYENTRRIYEQIPGQVMISYVAEDLGSQQSLLISREMIGTFLLPRMKRMVDLVHQAGAYAFFHSDGAIRTIIPDMLDIGMDVLDPVQWRCRDMDRAWLKEEFGERLIFHGAVDNQYTLAFGSVAEVREEVMYNIQVLGANGGYILGPCHNIQSISPPENIVAMYEAAYEYQEGGGGS